MNRDELDNLKIIAEKMATDKATVEDKLLFFRELNKLLEDIKRDIKSA